jgi:hypothetical protein
MALHRITLITISLFALMFLASCQSPQPSVPPASEFRIPAVGTPLPGGHEEALNPDIASSTSGVLFVNQTGLRMQVAVSDTIATIPLGEDFLFILPPGTYQFYLYQPDLAPRIHTETTTAGKVRYVYLSRALPR